MNNKRSIIQRLFPFGFRSDAYAIIKLSVPLAFSYILFECSMTFVSLLFMSGLGQAEFNASTLANTIYQLLIAGLLLGFNYASDTLFPQYFISDRRLMSGILQRAVIISIYPCFISAVLIVNMKHFLRWIEKDEHIVELVHIYMRDFLLVIPFVALGLQLRAYIAAAERTLSIIVANIIGNLVNILSHYICLYQLQIGIHAAPISITIANVSIVICYIVYIRFSSLYVETWSAVTRHCLKEWTGYLKYAVPGVFLVLAEWWAIETSTFFAAHINNDSLSAQSVLQQVAAVTFFIALAVGDASNIIIGQKIGVNQTHEARNTKNVAYVVIAGIAALNSSIIVLVHRWLPYVFHMEAPAAISLAQRGLLFIAFFTVIDAYYIVQNCICKSCGMQRPTVIIVIIGFSCIGLPVAYIMTFHFQMDIFGFWIGMLAGEIVTNVILFRILYGFDWEKYGQAVTDRISDEQQLLLTDDLHKNAPCGEAQEKGLRCSETTSKDRAITRLGLKVIFLVFLAILLVISMIMNY